MGAPALTVQVNGGPAISGDNLNTYEQTCDNVTQLRAFIGVTGVQVYMRGFSSVGDGGQGVFYWNAAGTLNDGINNIQPSGVTVGTWTRIPVVLSTGMDISNYTVISTGSSTARTLASRFQIPINVKDFGARGDYSSDDTAAINAAFAYAYTVGIGVPVYFPTGGYLVRESSVGSGHCILNSGNSVYGDNPDDSVILPYGTLASNISFMLVQPPTNVSIDWCEFNNFMIHPATLGSFSTNKQGGVGIVFNMTGGNANELRFSNVYMSSGNDYSVTFYTPSSSPNWVAIGLNSSIRDCIFYEGTKWTNAADSISYRNNVLRSSSGSNRAGINFTAVDNGTGGTSGCLLIDGNNSDCDGGFCYILGGVVPTITNNNIEQSTGSASLIYVNGVSTTISKANISHNLLGAFAVGIPSVIHLINTAGAVVDQNRILPATTIATGIAVDSTCTDTYLGFNSFGTGITTSISDSGAGTRGVNQAITPSNGFSNTGGGNQILSCIKNKDGIVTVVGYLTCPATPAGLVFGTLPSGFRPLSTQAAAIGAIVSTANTPQNAAIATSGAMTFNGSNSTTSIFFSISFPTLAYVVSNT